MVNVLLVLVLEELRVVVEVLVALGWLVPVKVHAGLLGLEFLHLLALDGCLLLLLFHLFLGDATGILLGLLLFLDLLELTKDVLVVQECVRKLITEDRAVKELADTLLDQGVAQDLVD